jgi:hypothetical protein
MLETNKGASAYNISQSSKKQDFGKKKKIKKVNKNKLINKIKKWHNQ